LTEYNDGKWHRWDGLDKCPVDERSIIDYYWIDLNMGKTGLSESRVAGGTSPSPAWAHITAFRVTKKYKEPLEINLHEDAQGNFATSAFMLYSPAITIRKFREVTE